MSSWEGIEIYILKGLKDYEKMAKKPLTCKLHIQSIYNKKNFFEIMMKT